MKTNNIEIDKFTFPNLFFCLKQYYYHFKKEYQNSLKKNDRIATGNLINNIDAEIEVNGKTVSVKLQLEPYWQWIEYNRLPTKHKGDGTVVDKIELWIKRKGIHVPDKMTTRQFAFAITNSIHKLGFKGTHDLQDTIDKVNKQWEETIRIALLADLKLNINKLLF